MRAHAGAVFLGMVQALGFRAFIGRQRRNEGNLI